MAGTLDRAHAIAEALADIAIKENLNPENLNDKNILKVKREDLFNSPTLKVPELGLDARMESMNSGLEEAKNKKGEPTASEAALMKLTHLINSSNCASARYFWELIAAVEAHAQDFYKDLPLAVAQ